MSNVKSNRWSFTAWDKPEPLKNELFLFLLYQAEYTADNKLHYQGYAEFKKDYTQAQVKRLIKVKRVHLEPSRESKTANTIYCTKSTGYAGFRYCLEDGVERTITHAQEALNELSDDDIFADYH